MAVGRWKITLGFAIGESGATESYTTPSAEISTMTARVSSLIAARLAFMHTSIRVTGLRIAQVADETDLPIKRRSLFSRPRSFYPFVLPDASGVGGQSYTLPATGQNAANQYIADPMYSSAQIRVTYGGGRQAQRYMSAFPDLALDSQPPTVALSLVPNLITLWAAFVTRIRTDGWSIRARSVNAPYQIMPILRWVNVGALPSLTGVQVNSTLAPAYPVGAFVYISGTRRKGTDTMSYNGRYVVESVTLGAGTAPTTVYLALSELGVAVSVKLPGTIQRIGYTWYPIDFMEPVQAAGHKRGRPLGGQRGSRKKRVLLDP